jgi:hypothetical protein
MEKEQFKSLFDKIAKKYGFRSSFGGWYIKNDNIIVILELQKSSFSNSYYLNIKIFIQGLFGKTYSIDKALVKSSSGIFTKQLRDMDVLNLEINMTDEQRKFELEILFRDILVPFVTKSLSLDGLKELTKEGVLVLLPAVKKELDWEED